MSLCLLLKSPQHQCNKNGSHNQQQLLRISGLTFILLQSYIMTGSLHLLMLLYYCSVSLKQQMFWPNVKCWWTIRTSQQPRATFLNRSALNTTHLSGSTPLAVYSRSLSLCDLNITFLCCSLECNTCWTSKFPKVD